MNTSSSSSSGTLPYVSGLYSPPDSGLLIDLALDANEGPGGFIDLASLISRIGPDVARKYPSAADLDQVLATRWGIDVSRLVVTAGGDEAIDRACRAFLAPGRELILPTPTFEMIARFATLAGATIRTTPWPHGPYPIDAVLGQVNERTAMIAMVSPNNPTGAVASASDLKRLAAAAPRAILLVDLAYAEFADDDLTAAAMEAPNAISIRTFSKCFGLAGLRIGYAMGSESNVRALRAVGSPFPVSSLSLAAAKDAIRQAPAVLPGVVARVRDERAGLSKLLVSLGSTPLPSQGNFVLAEFADADWVWRSLGSLGIGVRRFNPGAGLDRSLRITCPGNASSFDRLCNGLQSALRPQGLLFDVDGVLADVSGSYRRAIVLTADSFGVRLTPRDIDAAKAEGNANNDWVLTHRLLDRRGVSASLSEVTARFESLYHGGDGTPGLSASERLIPERALLERLAARLPLAIVTGRPRADCEFFLDRFGLRDLFRAVVCMEDAPLKPDPAPVRLALKQLGISAAWMIGDTPDDVNAARSAGVIPIGVPPPPPTDEPDGATHAALMRAGAARVLDSLNELEMLLP